MKYVIDICDEPINNDEGSPQLYKAKNFNSLVFDEEGLKRLMPCIERPIPDNQFDQEEMGWNLAGRILSGYYSESELVKMFGNNDAEYAIATYSYREAKSIIDHHEKNYKKIRQDVAKILEKRKQCLYKKEANECTYDCELCDNFVANDERIRALAYVIPMLREG